MMVTWNDFVWFAAAAVAVWAVAAVLLALALLARRGLRVTVRLPEGGVRRMERLGGGMGIMMDDILAGVYSAVLLGAARFLIG